MLLKSNAGYHTEIAPQQTNKKEHVATNAAFFVVAHIRWLLPKGSGNA